jgi:hypothetical protein
VSICLLCVVTAGCDSGGPSDGLPPADDTAAAGAAPAEDGAGPENAPEVTDLPGVPGSPIEYDSTLLGNIATDVQQSIEGELAGKCGPDRCGVRVEISYRGDGICATKIAPDPVRPQETITIDAGAGPCEAPNPPPDETGEPGPSSDTSPVGSETG